MPFTSTGYVISRTKFLSQQFKQSITRKHKIPFASEYFLSFSQSEDKTWSYFLFRSPWFCNCGMHKVSQNLTELASFLSSRITYACFRVLFSLLPVSQTLLSLFLVCIVRGTFGLDWGEFSLWAVWVIPINLLTQNKSSDDPAGERWINSNLIGFTYRMKKIVAEVDTT